MFERFDEAGRRVVGGEGVMQVVEELKHNSIDTPHILLALIKDESEGYHVLRELGVDTATFYNDIQEALGKGDREPSGHVPYTIGAKKVLELSLREALQFGHTWINTGHILLALIRHGQGITGLAFKGVGVDLTAARQTAAKLWGWEERKPEVISQKDVIDRLTAQTPKDKIVSGTRVKLSDIYSLMSIFEESDAKLTGRLVFELIEWRDESAKPAD